MINLPLEINIKMKYIKGNILQDSSQNRIIAHVCNNAGGFGAGFALAISKKYPEVKQKYKKWYESSKTNPHHFHLGNIQAVRINESLTIVNMLAQDGYKSDMNPVPLNYNALHLCLKQLRAFNKDKIPIWMPKIGSGLGGADWLKIEQMIEKILINEEVIIFEL